MRVVVAGGYGVFGSRLAELLLRDGHEVIVAGRDRARAEALAANLGCDALAVDIAAAPEALFVARPDVVVDAVGPFQGYAGDPYRLARLCIAQGADYLDFSDDARFTAGIAALDFAPDTLVASFHGMPERTLHLGDPYHCQCVKSARLLSEAIGRPVEIAFQSRFGRAKWLEPATDALLERLGREGRRVAIFAPGFSADCLETLEELAIRGKEQFEAAGGREFAYLTCLNDTPPGMAMLEALVRRELAGWY